MSEFAESLDRADSVYLSEIFTSAREQEGEVKIETLFEKIENGKEIIAIEDVSPLLDHEDAVMIFMGAGDVQKFERAYETLLSNTTRNRL